MNICEGMTVNIREELLSIMRRAGEIVLGAHNMESDGAVREKSGDVANMVTVYDVSVQNYLITEIKKLIPDAEFIAEEKENAEDSLGAEYCFVIDPIDGTANFVHNCRHSAISLAMISHGVTLFAAVYNPYLDEMFYAALGDGAYLNGQKIQASERDMPHSIVTVGTSPYYKNELGEATFSLCRKLFYACSDVRRLGSAALDLCYVAAGRTDIFFEYRLSPWDFAAGALIVTEAGGVITDMQGGTPSLAKPISILASNKNVHAAVLDIILRN